MHVKEPCIHKHVYNDCDYDKYTFQGIILPLAALNINKKLELQVTTNYRFLQITKLNERCN
jgi:hypothetical protein